VKKAPQPKHYNAKVKESSINLSAEDAVEKVWNEFWIPLFEGKEPSMEEVKNELGGYYFLMTNASVVYEEVTGGKYSNVNYTAPALLKAYAEHVSNMAKEMKQIMFDDLKLMADEGKVSIDEIAKYLEVDNITKDGE